jgi:DNA polymerase-3 subunit beta
MTGRIVPHKTVAAFMSARKIVNMDGPIKIVTDDAYIGFDHGTVRLHSKLIDGTYPEYGRVIPESTSDPVVFDVGDLSEAIAAVSLVSSERGRAVKMTVDNGVTLSVANPDSGTAKMPVACRYDLEDKRIEIGFNSRYLLDLIAATSPAGGEVSVHLTDSGSPAKFFGEQHGFLAVLMPMRV